VAAQLATFPLGLYYFNQFPNYFFITNLIVVPAAGWVIYSGLGAFALSSIPYLNEWVIQILDFIVSLISISIQSVNQLPYAVSNSIYISAFQSVLLYGLVIGFGLLISSRWKNAIFIILITLCFWQLNQSYNIIKTRDQNYLLFTMSSNFPGVEFINGRKTYILNDAQITDKYQIKNEIYNQFKINAYKYSNSSINSNIDLEFDENKIAIWTNNRIAGNLKAERTLLLNNFNSYLPFELDLSQCHQVILGKNVGYKTRKSLEKLKDSNHFEIKDLKHQDFWLVNL
jgi:competence protein ComEC